MINKVTLVGRLGADPELRHTKAQTAVTRVRLATTALYRDTTRNKRERTDWHNVVAWGKTAAAITDRTGRGYLIYVEGELRTSTWEDPATGQTRERTEIHVTTWRNFGAPRRSSAPDSPEEEQSPLDLPEAA